MKINKYPLVMDGTGFNITLPHVKNPAFGIQAKPLFVGLDNEDKPCIWISVDETEHCDFITVHVFMTGEQINKEVYDNCTYLGTVKDHGLILHIFYEL